jgi:hypothetical protein
VQGIGVQELIVRAPHGHGCIQCGQELKQGHTACWLHALPGSEPLHAHAVARVGARLRNEIYANTHTRILVP